MLIIYFLIRLNVETCEEKLLQDLTPGCIDNFMKSFIFYPDLQTENISRGSLPLNVPAIQRLSDLC